MPAHPAPLLSAAALPPSPSASADSGSPSPSTGSPRPGDAQSPLAGLPAGEGRERPGRPMTPSERDRDDALDAREEQPEATAPAALPAVTPEPSTPAGSGRLSQQALEAPAAKQVQDVSLGAGIALVGLGLGFLAFRMRRTF
ncbi:hypothetical protein OG782_17980 [Streptomyces sp. NBC_00876]|uniref:hypothetical protein n=1 Tax=Streptomyces sp. NBC_00876 TaxID=2975853 RepID=UPI0038643D9A|nr:hypothetical protein OG782_17980 [Streptomyces sp. NBC_00876]